MPTSTSSYGRYSSYSSLYSSYPSYRSPSSSSYLNRTTSLDRSSYLGSSGSSGSSSSSSSSSNSTGSSSSGSTFYRYYSGNKGLSSLPPRPSYSAISDTYKNSRSLRVSPNRSSYSRLSSDYTYPSDRESKYSYNRISKYPSTKDSGYDSYGSSRDRSIDVQNGNSSTNVSRRNSLRQYEYDYDSNENTSVLDKIRGYESWNDPAEERLAQRRRRLGLSPARDVLDSFYVNRTRANSIENRNSEEKSSEPKRDRQLSPTGKRKYDSSSNLVNGNISADEILGCSGGSGPSLVVKDTSVSDGATPRSRLNSYNKDDNNVSPGLPKSPSRSPRAKSPVEEKVKYHPKISDNDTDSFRSSYTLPFRSRDRKEKLKERIASRLANEVQSENSLNERYSSTSKPGSICENRGLVGLRNIGNTCFMNSIIQCLSNTRCLMEYIVKDGYFSDINSTLSTMKGDLIKAFANLIKELWSNGTTGPLNTGPFKSQIQRFAPTFIGYAQHDAQEFLRKLLEGLHEDVNRVTVRPRPIIEDIDDDLDEREKSMESWKRYLRLDNSKIVDMFVGQLKSCLRCSLCDYESITFDPFWDLSLPIPSRSSAQVRLTNCLDLFTKEEILDGDEKPTCARCKERRKMSKSFSIQKFPQVLVLHLKRFAQQERYRGKLTCTVDFPLDDLDLSNYSSNTFISARYKLTSVVNHSGTAFSGHYTAYCRHPYLDTWHEYNDSMVTSTKAARVCSAAAYVLFYELCPY